MKIKNLFTLLFLLFILITLSASTSIKVKKEERHVESFSKINVGSAFAVYLSQGSEQSVIVETEDKYIDKIKTTVRNGTLHVALDDLKERKNQNLKTLNLYITIPEIEGIEASAAANIKMETSINNDKTISIKLSGATSLNNLTLKCKKLEMELSGASKSDINLIVDKVDANISGASKLELSGNVDVLNIHGSGASNIDVRNLDYNKGDIETAGATKLKK